jgi:hypothetical protein
MVYLEVSVGEDGEPKRESYSDGNEVRGGNEEIGHIDGGRGEEPR